ncbi:MAG TPA: hypothetical protein PKD90_14750 [Phnomibacter sp.]|nr:hypothetical protein [Phnomibacter sp.]
MRSFYLSILVVLYLLGAAGTVMQYHFCMGSLQEVSVAVAHAGSQHGHGDDEAHICGKCGMVTDSQGCCQSEHTAYQITDPHAVAPAQDLPAFFYNDPGAHPTATCLCVEGDNWHLANVLPIAHPPPLFNTSLQWQGFLCVFRC